MPEQVLVKILTVLMKVKVDEINLKDTMYSIIKLYCLKNCLDIHLLHDILIFWKSYKKIHHRMIVQNLNVIN